MLFPQKPVPFHLNYPVLKDRLPELDAKRVILTHMHKEMLAEVDNVPEECAYDGLVVEI